ncbi:extracellular solute-binding protein, partial [Halopenitus persicus]
MAEAPKTCTRLKKKLSRRQVIQAAGGTSIVGLAGCLQSSGDPSDESSPSTDSGGSSTSTGGSSIPDKPDTLVVRAWGGSWQEALDQAVAQPFSEDTGITVEYDNTEGEVMHGKIRTAINQGRTPPVHVNWATTPYCYRAYAQDLSQELDQDVVSNLSSLLAATQPDTETDWPYVNLYSYVYSLSYNTDTISETPASWTKLWNDEWDDSIGLFSDGGGFIPVVAEITDTELGPAESMEPVWDKIRELKPNVGALGDTASISQSLRSGETPMVCQTAATAYNLKTDGAPVDFTVPEEGALAQRDGMYIPKNLDPGQTYWGQKFINYAAA